MEEESEADLREQIFHNNVREQIIFLLLFIGLYLCSFMLIEKFRRRDREDIYSADEEEVKVYRISLWLCTFGLAVSLGSALLLPVSIVSNEVLILYPNSYYVKWLNSSLIQGLWSHVFLFSNLSLFVFLPFAYLFSESAGFAGGRGGLLPRLYETCTVLGLLAAGMLGLAFVVSALIDEQRSSIDALLNLWTYLPFLYSCVSFVGVLMLLVSTPLGFVRLFGVVGQVLVKPHFLRDLNEEYYVCRCEQETLRRRIQNARATGASYISPEPMCAARGVAAAGAAQRRAPGRPAGAPRPRRRPDEGGGRAPQDFVPAEERGVPARHAAAAGAHRHHGADGAAEHARAADRHQGPPSQHQAIHTGHRIAVEAGLGRRHAGGLPHPVPARGVPHRPLLGGGRAAAAAAAARDAAHQDHRHVLRAARAQHRRAAARQDTGHHQLRPAGRLRAHRVARQLPAGAALQPGVRGGGDALSRQQVHRHRAHRALQQIEVASGVAAAARGRRHHPLRLHHLHGHRRLQLSPKHYICCQLSPTHRLHLFFCRPVIF